MLSSAARWVHGLPTDKCRAMKVSSWNEPHAHWRHTREPIHEIRLEERHEAREVAGYHADNLAFGAPDSTTILKGHVEQPNGARLEGRSCGTEKHRTDHKGATVHYEAFCHHGAQ